MGDALALLRDRLSRFSTPASRQRGLALQARESDVFVATFPKSGTTWTQQIVQQLRSGAPPFLEFNEISCVVPWLEMAVDCGQEPDAPQAWAPRCFKTHLWAPACPRGGRVIVVVRDPRDVVVSFYRFFSGWLLEPQDLSLDTFVEELFLARGTPADDSQSAGWWEHLLSWWREAEAHPDRVLLLFYEDMLADLPAAVDAIADFMGADASPSVRAAAVAHSSFAFMSAPEHARHFDDHLIRATRDPVMGLQWPRPAGGGKVQQGVAGGGAARLSPQALAALEARWAAVREATGAGSYDELRAMGAPGWRRG